MKIKSLISVVCFFVIGSVWSQNFGSCGFIRFELNDIVFLDNTTVKYGLGYGSVLDYEFTYFGRDSIRVVLSMPPDSYPLWSFWYDSVMLHLQQERVDSICCFANGGLRHVEHYYYDDNGRMIERTYLWGSRDTFSWEGDNETASCMFGDDYEYNVIKEKSKITGNYHTFYYKEL